HDQREWRVNERHRNGRDIDDKGDKILAGHSPVQPLKLEFMMMAGDRRAQEIERKRARSRDGCIKRDRERQRVMVAEINCDPGDKRDPKKQVHVCPKNDRIDAADEVNEIMMIDPVDRDDDEAKDVSEK